MITKLDKSKIREFKIGQKIECVEYTGEESKQCACCCMSDRDCDIPALQCVGKMRKDGKPTIFKIIEEI